MKIRRLKLIFLVFILGCTFIGCSRFNGYQKSGDGLYYRFIRQTDGRNPEIGHIVQVNLTYSFGDSVMFNSNSLKAPMNLIVNPPDFRGDINHALLMMGIGDSASFIIRADSFFIHTMKYNRLPRNVTKETFVTLNIGLHKIWTQEEQRKEEEAWKASRKAAELAEIKHYITDNNLKIDTTPEGLYFRLNRKGSGAMPAYGDKIRLNFSVSLLNGTSIFSSWEKGLPMEIEFGRKFDTEGINLALQRMNKGSVARLIIPSKLAFGEKGREGFIPPYAPLVYDVEVVEILTLEDIRRQKEREAEDLRKNEGRHIAEYVAANNLKASPTPSGLYYIEARAGKGEKPKVNQKVKVHYTGYLLNGKKFDSSVDRGQPFEFVLGVGNVIKGWDEGIAMMRKGSKAKLIIPSNLGYGERGAQPNIPPYAPLIFEVELIDYE